MKVIEIKDESGILQQRIFRREDEDTTGFKQAVKDWIAANAPMGWGEFFNRLEFYDGTRITLDMI